MLVCSESYQEFGRMLGALTHDEYLELAILVSSPGGHSNDAKKKKCLEKLVNKGKKLGSDAINFTINGRFQLNAKGLTSNEDEEKGTEGRAKKKMRIEVGEPVVSGKSVACLFYSLIISH